ncbi:hypothetical protein HYFRA_00000202 [Hymenoscyphus fraxineus]|uniref:Uncharacterized protein n=1 Tax=Hymenoscyphus fraxineus TaxID=746836 RepID=A0A9N9PXP7_9HELO|nr:hypothetical protein HYFRA_00000202 [Hymenoscyphus fraxineus]
MSDPDQRHWGNVISTLVAPPIRYQQSTVLENSVCASTLLSQLATWDPKERKGQQEKERHLGTSERGNKGAERKRRLKKQCMRDFGHCQNLHHIACLLQLEKAQEWQSRCKVPERAWEP